MAREVPGGRPTPLAVSCYVELISRIAISAFLRSRRIPSVYPSRLSASFRRTHFPKRMNSGPPNFFH